MAKNLKTKWLSEGYPIEIIDASLQSPFIAALENIDKIDNPTRLVETSAVENDNAQLPNL